MSTIPARRAAAFSIVECVVVMALIVLLITMLAPSLRKARERADEVRCAGGLHQLGKFVSEYTVDYDGKFPRMFYGLSAAAGSEAISVTVEARTRRRAGILDVPDHLLVCPTDLAPAIAPVVDAQDPDVAMGLPLSYSYNLASSVRDMRYPRIQTFAPYERWPVFFDGVFGPQIQGAYLSPVAFASETYVTRHPSGPNVLYADWHAEPALRFRDVLIDTRSNPPHLAGHGDDDGPGGKGNGKGSSDNQGHGNNQDSVDVSNPGKGKGGPHAGGDPSGDVDDERP